MLCYTTPSDYDKKIIDDFIALTRLRGTLMEKRLGVYRFIHLAFQEYLTARYLAEIKRGEAGVEGIAAFLETGPILDSWWREPSLLVAGYLSVTSPQTAQMFLRRLGGVDREAVHRHRKLAAEVQMAAAEVAASGFLDCQTAYGDLRQTLANRLVMLFQDVDLVMQVRPALRVTAGDTLAHLGDPRFDPEAWYLPKEDLLGFVEIPEGPFLMGSDPVHDKEAFDSEQEQHPVTMPRYYVAEYPVTVAQFCFFVEKSNYKPRDKDTLRGLSNHPVVNVTWHDAIAYCKWLTDELRNSARTPEPLATLLRQGDWRITLPSEAEWEKAARGGHELPNGVTNPNPGRIHPWEGAFDPNKANTYETKIGETSAVGCFPDGASPYGVLDMSGNVWEWCADWFNENEYKDRKGTTVKDPQGPKEGSYRVLRGGSFIYSHGVARCAYRHRDFPDLRLRGFGFRVVASLF